MAGVAGSEEFSVECIQARGSIRLKYVKYREKRVGRIARTPQVPSPSGEKAARQSQVGNEPSNIAPPLDGDAGVRGELWVGDLLPLVKAIGQGETLREGAPHYTRCGKGSWETRLGERIMPLA